MPTVDYAHDAYISYCPPDRTWVEETLAPRLKAAGLDVIAGDRDFEVGRARISNIERAIDTSRHTLLVITPAWLNSAWAELENLLASSLDPAGRQRRMIPLILAPTELPTRLAMFTAADFTGSATQDDAEMQRLIRGLKARARVYIAAQPAAEIDAGLAQRIGNALAREGHAVFTVADLPVGMKFAAGVRHLIELSDFVVSLLSPQSVADARIVSQLQVAYEISAASQHGRLLPVRVKFTDALPATISPYFEDVGYVLWRDFDDDETIIRKLHEAITLFTTQLEPVAKAEAPMTKATAAKAKLWPNGAVIRVRFLDGDADLRWKVAQIASEWMKYANLRFIFGDDPDSEVRISFKLPGSWSYQALDALAIAKDQPTVNFGWLTAKTNEQEVRRVVLHEFGHVVGLVHEHQISTAAIPWNKGAVYRYYGGPPNNWTKQQVEQLFFQTYPEDYFPIVKQFDPQSIMAFPVLKQMTDGIFEIGWNMELSEYDKAFAAQLYPAA